MNELINKYRSLSVLVKASFWYLICSFLQKAISTITTPIFTRILTTAEYGEFSVFNSWNAILAIIITLNLGAGIFLQALVKNKNNQDTYASAMQGLVVTLCIFWICLYLLFYQFWNSLFHLTSFQMLAMILIIWSSTAFSFWATVQRVDYNYKILVIFTLIISIIKPIVEILLVLVAEDKVSARIFAMLVTNLLAYSYFFFIQIKKGKCFYSKKFWVYAIKYNIPLLPHYLSAIVLSSMDRIMIGKMVSLETAGIYTLAYSLSQIMSLFNSALLSTVEPWLYQKIKEKDLSSIGRITYISLLIVAIMNILLISLAPEAVRLFAPKEYYDAIWIIPPVAMSVFFTFMYSFYAVFEFYYEKQVYVAIATTLGAGLNIMLNFIFIKKFGYMAAGYTTLICYILFALFHYYFMRRICFLYLENQKPYNARIIISISSCFMFLSFAFLYTYNSVILRYSLIAIIIVILFLKKEKIIKSLKPILTIQNKKENEI